MCRHIVGAGPEFRELSLSVCDLLSSVLMMYFTFLLLFFGNFLQQEHQSSWNCGLGSSWYDVVLLSRLRKNTAVFPCTLRSPKFEALKLSPDK